MGVGLRLPGCVYVVGHVGGPQKVGRTTNVRQRVRALERQMGRGLIVHSTEAMPYDLLSGCEDLAHEKLGPWSMGEELFDVPPTYAVEAVREAAQEARSLYLPTSCIRDARVMLGWTVQRLADRAGVGVHLACAAGKEQHVSPWVRGVAMRAIRQALEAAGIQFVPEICGGVGVRLRDVEPNKHLPNAAHT